MTVSNKYVQQKREWVTHEGCTLPFINFDTFFGYHYYELLNTKSTFNFQWKYKFMFTAFHLLFNLEEMFLSIYQVVLIISCGAIYEQKTELTRQIHGNILLPEIRNH